MRSAEVRFLGRHVSQDCEWENPEVQVKGNGDCDVAGRQRHELKTNNLSATRTVQDLFLSIDTTTATYTSWHTTPSFSGNYGYVLVSLFEFEEAMLTKGTFGKSPATRQSTVA
jgi:hypothetical protein